MNIDQSYLFPLSSQVIHGFLGGLSSGAHKDNDPFCIRCSVILEEMIVTACQLVDLLHIVLYGLRNSRNLLIAGLTALEEDIRIHSGTSGAGVFRIQRVLTEGLEGIHIY